MPRKIYIAGKITGLDDYKERFKTAEEHLLRQGYSVMSPAKLEGKFEQAEFLHVCFAMIDVCEAVFFLDNWKDSPGAKTEHDYAIRKEKWIKYQTR